MNNQVYKSIKTKNKTKKITITMIKSWMDYSKTAKKLNLKWFYINDRFQDKAPENTASQKWC